MSQYKGSHPYDLRMRNPSQAGTVDPDNSQLDLHSRSVSDSTTDRSTTDLTLPGSQDSQKTKLSVIDMAYFKEVEANHKLDLLMVAINKINTNFHYKLEAMQKEFTSTVRNVCDVMLPKIQNLEKCYEELNARMDDMETSLPEFKDINRKMGVIDQDLTPAVTDLQTRLSRVEVMQSQIADDLTIVKGFLQVHDKKITSTG